MRISVAGQPGEASQFERNSGLRSAGELAPELALPWVVKLRYGLAAGQFWMVLGAHLIAGAELLLTPVYIPIGMSLATNAVLPRAAARFGNPRRWIGAVFCLDTLCLTAILALTGGPSNPFTVFYLVLITVSAVVLNKGWTWALGALSTAGFGFLFPFHRSFKLLEPGGMDAMRSGHLMGMFLAFAVGAALISFFIGKVSEVLRRSEQEVLSLHRRLAKNDRLASLVTLAAGAAHELATPMATIAVAAKELEHRASEPDGNPEMREDACLIRSEVERCRAILQRMSGRDTAVDVEGDEAVPVAVRALLESALASLGAAARGRIRLEVGDVPELTLPVRTVEHALAALVGNALEASPHGPVMLAVRFRGGRVEFAVRDSGCGMKPEVMNRLAEPFFTTKEPGRGMGLGLFLARLVAERLGGSLVFESEPGKGTTVLFELPAARAGEPSNGRS